MTKERAIEEIKEIIQIYQTGTYALMRCEKTALEMAIEALEKSEVPKDMIPLSVIEDIKAEIEARMKNCRKEHSEIVWDTADITNGIIEQTSYGQGLGLREALGIIDRKVNEVEREDNTRPYYANEWLDEGKVNEVTDD